MAYGKWTVTRLFQMSARISPGSFGGPVFNSRGEVIGVAVLTITEGQNLNFAIPLDYARGMLSMSQPRPLASIHEPEPLPEPRTNPDLAKVHYGKQMVGPVGFEPTTNGL